MRLWFIRHGEVESPYVGAFVGKTDVALSDVGRHQAQAVADFLVQAEPDAVLASPLQRARDTALPLAAATSRHVMTRHAFAEMDFGAWDGLHWDAITERDPDLAPKWAQDSYGGAVPRRESVRDFHDRIASALDDVLAEFKDRTVALVSHAGTNRAILASILGVDYMRAFHFAQDYGCVNAASFGDDHAQVALLNVVPGPASGDNGDGPRP